MKLFFGVDITEDQENEVLDGEIFVTERMSSGQEKTMEETNEKLKVLYQQSDIPTSLRIVRTLSGLAALICFVGLLRGIKKTTISQAYVNAPWVFYILGITLIIWVVLTLMGRFKRKNMEQSEELKQATMWSESMQNSAYAQLGVPDDASVMNVLMAKYKRKNGKIVFKPIEMGDFISVSVKAFIADGALCFVDLLQKFEIPLSSLTGIRTIQEKASTSNWDKDVPFNQGEYKQYKMRTNQFGQIFFKSYYALCIQYGGEEYELYIPPYERPLIQRLTGDIPEL